MVGRKKELDYLTNGFSPRGNLRCSVISGEEGIGKSTLIRELISNLTKNHPSSLLMHLESADCDDSAARSALRPQEAQSQFAGFLLVGVALDRVPGARARQTAAGQRRSAAG